MTLPDQEPTQEPNDDDELPPLSVLVDMLQDAVDLLDGVADLVGAHRRAVGDDHHELVRLQAAAARIGQAWAATMSARKVLSPRG